jgi:hypothetical protein
MKKTHPGSCVPIISDQNLLADLGSTGSGSRSNYSSFMQIPGQPHRSPVPCKLSMQMTCFTIADFLFR